MSSQLPPWATVPVPEIRLRPGETVTVWLHKDHHGYNSAAEQVELRVTYDGELEVFCDSIEIIKPFEEWS